MAGDKRYGKLKTIAIQRHDERGRRRKDIGRKCVDAQYLKHWYRGIVSINVQNRENKLSPRHSKLQTKALNGTVVFLNHLMANFALFRYFRSFRLGHPNAKDGLNGRQEEQHHVKVLRCNAELGDRL